MVASPTPLTCQSLAGSPGNVFSQAITLVTGGPQGLPAAAAGAGNTTGITQVAANNASTSTMRLNCSDRVRRGWVPPTSVTASTSRATTTTRTPGDNRPPRT